MHDRNVEVFLQPFFYGEALRCLDVLKVDAAEGRSDFLNGFAEFVGILLVYLDVEYIDAAVDLEQQAFAFHDRLAAHGADVAQSQDGRTVADDGHQVAFVGVFIYVVGILLDFQTGISHARRISQAEICLCAVRFCRLDLDLTWAAVVMIFQSRLFCYLDHN